MEPLLELCVPDLLQPFFPVNILELFAAHSWHFQENQSVIIVAWSPLAPLLPQSIQLW